MYLNPLKPILATATKLLEINPSTFVRPLVLFGNLNITRGSFLCKKPRVFHLNFWKQETAWHSDPPENEAEKASVERCFFSFLIRKTRNLFSSTNHSEKTSNNKEHFPSVLTTNNKEIVL